MTLITSTLRAIAAPAMLACAIAAAPTAAAQDYVRFTTDGQSCGFDDNGRPISGGGTHVRVALNNETGKLAVSGFGEGWYSAQWVLNPVGEPRPVPRSTATEQDFEITNLWTKEHLIAYYVGPDKANKKITITVAPETLQIPDFTNGNANVGPDGTRAKRALSAQEVVWTIRVLPPVPANDAGFMEDESHGRKVTMFQQRIREERTNDVYIGLDGCDLTDKPGVQWRMKKTGAVPLPEKAWVWLHPQGDNKSIHVESGTPALGDIQEGWLSAMWEAVELRGGQNLSGLPAGNGMPTYFVNRWTGKAIGINAARTGLEVVDAPTIDNTGRVSNPNAIWRVMGDGGDTVSLQNGDRYLAQNKGNLILDASRRVIWMLDPTNPVAAVVAAPPPVEAYVRLELSGGQALNIETGAPNATTANAGWWSAQWVEVEMRGSDGAKFVAYKNRWTDMYLAVSGGQLTTTNEQGLGPQGPASSNLAWQWVGGGPKGEFSLKHALTGQYLHGDKSGVKLSTDANGARVWIAKPVQ